MQRKLIKNNSNSSSYHFSIHKKNLLLWAEKKSQNRYFDFLFLLLLLFIRGHFAKKWGTSFLTFALISKGENTFKSLPIAKGLSVFIDLF